MQQSFWGKAHVEIIATFSSLIHLGGSVREDLFTTNIEDGRLIEKDYEVALYLELRTNFLLVKNLDNAVIMLIANLDSCRRCRVKLIRSHGP